MAMRVGAHHYHWNTPMPVRPVAQGHEAPNRGDNKSAILRAARAGGVFTIDGNLQIMDGEIWLAHWSTPALNGYTRVVDAKTGKVRAMTRAERHRSGYRWGKEGIRRWRRPNGERPLTYEEAVAFAVQHGVIIVGELKTGAFAQARYADKLIAICKKYDHPAWFKALFNMKNPAGKCAATRKAGGQFALIFGRYVAGRVRRLAAGRRISKQWATKPTRIW